MENDLRDKALGNLLRGLFAAHPRLKAFGLTVRVKGGVAHISGTVATDRDKALTRVVAARLNGIRAVWDVLRKRRARAPAVVDLGCADKKQIPSAWGVDYRPYASVDVIADLEKGLPFRDGSVDYIFAVHCLEHLRDLVAAMNEIHRVLSPSGAAHILTPHAACTNAVADPTHVRFFNRQTFKYFCTRRTGVRLFRPINVCATEDNVFCDLAPVKNGTPAIAGGELSLFFD